MAMMQAQGIGQDSPINKLAMSIAQRAMASDDPAGVLAHYKSMPDAKLAAFLADGLVQTQLAASHNQQAIQNYNPQQPSVLDRLTQAQGVVNLPVSQQMFDPAMHQEGIAAGAGEATRTARLPAAGFWHIPQPECTRIPDLYGSYQRPGWKVCQTAHR